MFRGRQIIVAIIFAIFFSTRDPDPRTILSWWHKYTVSQKNQTATINMT